MMFTDTDLSRILAAMRQHAVSRLSFSHGAQSLELALPAGPITPPAPPAPAEIRAVKSPSLGAFEPRGHADALAPLAEGAKVARGEVLGHIRLGDLRVAVTSPASGRLIGASPEPERITGYGDTLFELEADA